MDHQHILWTNLLNPVDTQNLPDPPVLSDDTNMLCANLAGEGSADLSMWSSGGPSSSRNPISQSSHEETKMEFRWSSPLTINGGQGQVTEESRLEATDMLLGLRREEHRFKPNDILPLEDVNLNLNSNKADNNQSFPQNPSADDFINNSDHNAGYDGTSSRVPESGKFWSPNNSGSLGSLQISPPGGSLNLYGSSSSGIGFLAENCEGPPGSSSDGQRIAKRKSIERVPAQSSSRGSSSCLYQNDNSLVHSVSARPNANTTLSISGTSDYLSGINPPAEQLNSRISTTVRLGFSDCHPYSVAENPESSQRNCRVRINPPQRGAASPTQWPPGSNLRPSDPWSFHQPSLLNPFTQALDSRVVAAGTSEVQPRVIPVSGLVPNLPSLSWNGASSSRTSSSLRYPAIAGQRTVSSTRALAMAAQRSISSREESSSRSTSRNSISENLVFTPTTDSRSSVQDPPIWGLTNGTTGIGHVAPVAQAITASRVNQVAGPTWIPHQNPPSLYQRGFTEVRRSLSSGGSGSVPGINLSRSANSSTSHEITPQSSAAVRGNQQHYARSAMLMDRRVDGVVGIPLTMRSVAATREGRSRILQEQIRNAMQLARRGENMIPLEDILFFDHAVYHRGAGDFHDRHRDLRLDVDNMSYEELLALEERIGNVSTGLSEETVMKYLKQRIYISLSEEPPSEVEPCCVCQENYVEGDEVGRLNCGHDFHTACVKQWLMQKNLCPICKTTALDTEKHKRGAHCFT